MARPALSASRAIDVLQFLAAHPDVAFTYSELSARLGVNLASLHAVLHELEVRQFVSRDPATKRYSLGLAVVATGDAALRRHRSVDLLRTEMASLAASLRLRSVAYASVRFDMLCVASSRSEPGSIQVGQRVPLLAPFGMAFMAWSPPDAVRIWLQRAGMSGARRGHTLDDLALVRRRGYSATVDLPTSREVQRLVVAIGEHPHAPELWRALRREIAESTRNEVRGRRPRRVRDITAPVFDAGGRPAIVLTLQGFTDALHPSEIESVVAELQRVTASVTAASGGVVPS